MSTMPYPTYQSYKDLDLKGRYPGDLAQKSTCSDILLELEDTGQFSTNWLDVSTFVWSANGKTPNYYYERGEVVQYSMAQIKPSGLGDFCQMKVVETKYRITRLAIRLNVHYSGPTDKVSIIEANSLSKEVYDRLMAYIGIDVIQSQFLHTNFQIDFIISECQII